MSRNYVGHIPPLAAFDWARRSERFYPYVKATRGRTPASGRQWIKRAGRTLLIHTYSTAMFVLDEDAVGYKQVIGDWRRIRTVITLLIPAGAIVHLSDYKCRATEAFVVAGRGYSQFHTDFCYEPGQFKVPECAFNSQLDVCGSGIHFFRTPREAKQFVF